VLKVYIKDQKQRPALKEIIINIIRLKQLFEQEEIVLLDSQGKFKGEKDFGKCNTFIILRKFETSLGYTTMNIKHSQKLVEPQEGKTKTGKSIVDMDMIYNSSKVKQDKKNLSSFNKSNNLSKNDLDMILMRQSVMTSYSKQLHNVNNFNQSQFFNANDVLKNWSGKIFNKINPFESKFTKSLFNIPLKSQNMKDQAVIGLMKELVGGNKTFIAWDFSSALESSQIPDPLIKSLFKEDCDIFLEGLMVTLKVFKQIEDRITKSIHLNNS
jgi:hypothetical protein